MFKIMESILGRNKQDFWKSGESAKQLEKKRRATSTQCAASFSKESMRQNTPLSFCLRWDLWILASQVYFEADSRRCGCVASTTSTDLREDNMPCRCPEEESRRCVYVASTACPEQRIHNMPCRCLVFSSQGRSAFRLLHPAVSRLHI